MFVPLPPRRRELFKQSLMKDQTLFNQIPGYPCYYSLKTMEGMDYEYRMSETKVLRFVVRHWGSHAIQNFAIREGNKTMIDHARRLWGDTMQLMDRSAFLEAIGLSLEEFQVLERIALRFEHQ